MKRIAFLITALAACFATPLHATDRKPIVLAAGKAQQLQTGDALSVADISQSGANSMVATGSTPMIDLRTNNTNVKGGTYFAPNNAFSYYPIVGWQVGDFQRAQGLIRFKSEYAVTRSETGLAIDTYVNTGLAATYAVSTAYTAGQYVVVPAANYIYQVGGACTSGGTAPTWPASGSVGNGTCTFTWAAYGQQNAKMPLFVQTVADSGAGNTWSGVFNTIYKSGWRGQFGASVEVDITNNSGIAQPNLSGIFLASGGGSNTIGSGLTISGAASGSNFLDAIAIGGTAASQSDLHSYSAATYGLLDNGTHNFGVYLNGTYSGQAAFIGGTTSNTDGTGSDQGQVMISPTTGANRLMVGYVYQAGVKEYGRIQAANGSGATALWLNPTGGAVLIGSGGAQINSKITQSVDFAELRMRATSGTNLNAWRLISNVGTTVDGSLVFQHTTDNYAASFQNPLTLTAAGTVQLGTFTVGGLPTCNAGAAGSITYVTDATAPTYNATLTGGGAIRALAMCNGTNWTAH